MLGKSNQRNRSSRRAFRRRGTIVVLAAFLMIAMMACLAFSIDVGMITNARTEIQRATDAGALAGAGALASDPSTLDGAVRDYVRYNPVGGRIIPNQNIEVELGTWNEATRQFSAGGETPGALRVSASQTGQPTFFGGFFSRPTYDVQSESVAVFRPRDIVVVLDLSGSMNDDSELKHISKLGRTAIEQNLQSIHQQLGAPAYGSLPWNPAYLSTENNQQIKEHFGLDQIPYPYPQGSWDEFINYVKSNGNVNSAGYRKKYGLLTLVNYWLERRPGADETPDLWKTDEQPVTAVKDAVNVFLAYLQEAQANDRVGLSVYTSADGTGKLESELTYDMALIEQLSRECQAGHYHVYTNISAGMEKAREELDQNGRAGAQKMMVLLTDGKANRPTNQSVARQKVREEAQLAADLGFPVVTISLGTSADKQLMQAVADVTGGVHFNVPGGGGVSQYEDDLKDVFREIAGARPLALVQ